MSLFVLALGCLVTRSEEMSAAALTLASQAAPARVTSLLLDNFSVSVTLDLPAGDVRELPASASIGYRRTSVASIGHLTDPADQSARLVLFRKPLQPGLTSLTWGNFQAGFGRIFPNDSVLARGNNGTAWEEPGCLYLKTSFRF